MVTHTLFFLLLLLLVTNTSAQTIDLGCCEECTTYCTLAKFTVVVDLSPPPSATLPPYFATSRRHHHRLIE